MMIAGGLIWIAVMVLALIAVLFVLRSRQSRADQSEYVEKPKRGDSTRSHLVLGDDGELVEIIDDDDNQPKRKRDQS